MIIPIIIICYNNYKYVENTVKQLVQRKLGKNIIIFDNKSTCEETINYLKNVKQLVFYNKENNGPWISKDKNAELYNLLPENFILTDPDLELNPNLPENFIEILLELSDKYKSEKVGFALDISDYSEMFQDDYFCNNNIRDWELQWWGNKIIDTEYPYELYDARIDTTFALMSKKYSGNNIRVAGNFTAKHLPWYRDNKVFNIYENYLTNSKTTNISTISRVFLNYVQNNFIKVEKNREVFFIKESNKDPYVEFWKNFSGWQNNLFLIFDKILNPDKNYFEIGAGIGETILYAARKSKHVYAIENNMKNFQRLSEHSKNNIRNYQLFKELESDSLKLFFTKNNVSYEDTSLIKVNVRGKEEGMLEELNEINQMYRVPVLITFYYEYWLDKNLNRFSFLSEAHKESISKGSEVTLIFINQT